MKKPEIAQQALDNALNNQSTANYTAIFEGFAAMGINLEDVKPRENVFTFDAWLALGRVVMKGQHGVKVVTFVTGEKVDKETGEKTQWKRAKTTTVFHISQTKPTDDKPEPDNTDQEDAPTEGGEALATGGAIAAVENNDRQIERRNHYEERQAAKKERFEALADKSRAASDATYQRARNMAEVIPFGQPILVGHHSEKRDRRYRGRIDDNMRKSVELQKKADYYQQKAASVGSGGISSDDPDALEKLREKLAKLEAKQTQMKTVNKVIRVNKTPESQTAALMAMGFSEAVVLAFLKGDSLGRLGFADFELTNNNANIRRIKSRVVELEKAQSRADVEQVNDAYTYKEDLAENRVMFIFNGKPDQEIRSLLKSNGFKWSPTRSAWVRQLNNAGCMAGRYVRQKLDAIN